MKIKKLMYLMLFLHATHIFASAPNAGKPNVTITIGSIGVYKESEININGSKEFAAAVLKQVQTSNQNATPSQPQPTPMQTPPPPYSPKKATIVQPQFSAAVNPTPPPAQVNLPAPTAPVMTRNTNTGAVHAGNSGNEYAKMQSSNNSNQDDDGDGCCPPCP